MVAEPGAGCHTIPRGAEARAAPGAEPRPTRGLLGDQLVARVDLKADRAAHVLRVPAAHAEEGANQRRVAAALIDELRAMAGWLGLDTVETSARGGLLRAGRYAV